MSEDIVHEKEDFDIESILVMMDEASGLRRQKAEVIRQLDIHEVKDDIKQRIYNAAEVKGEELTDEIVDAAINNYLSGLYAFKEPPKSLQTTSAGLYIDRVKIARKFGIPALGVASAALVFYGLFSGTKAAINHFAQKGVEERVEEVCWRNNNQENELTNTKLRSEPYLDDELNSLITSAQSHLDDVDSFYEKYCTGESVSITITSKNFQDAKSELEYVDKSLISAAGRIEDASTIIILQENLGQTKQGLDSVIQNIRTSAPHPVLLERAENEYQEGLSNIEKEFMLEAQDDLAQLENIRTEVHQFNVLPDEIHALYSHIFDTAQEPQAKDLVNSLFEVGQIHIDNVNVYELNQTVEELRNLNQTLNLEYVLRIVSRENEKSGIDRYYTDDSGTRASGFYLILEAIDKNGNAIPQFITNEENGQTEQVTIWGERIPECVYEKVKSDKIDDGIIQDDTIGYKDLGYLNPVITFYDCDGVTPLIREGQITDW